VQVPTWGGSFGRSPRIPSATSARIGQGFGNTLSRIRSTQVGDPKLTENLLDKANEGAVGLIVACAPMKCSFEVELFPEKFCKLANEVIERAT
jgi:hypothetical protein